MTRHLDPDRSRPPTFWPFPIDIDTSVCDRCSAMVPATDKAHEQHRTHHHQIDQLTTMAATVALTSQLSGSGSQADDVTTSDSPDPDPNVPTPEQEDTESRSGVGDAKDTQADAAGLPPGSVTGAPAAFPPAAGAINRSRPGGSSSSSSPTGRLPLPELGDPARFAR